MFSMAGVSLFLSFLPLLPKQILFGNLLSDLPEMALASDNVDPEIIRRPAKWDLRFIRRFMIVFGLLNSLADFLTFGVLLFWLRADTTMFRTGWFIENVVSAALIVLAIRTRGLLFKSKPSPLLIFSVLFVAIGVIFIPFTPLGTLLGFGTLPLIFYPFLGGIVVIYVAAVEIAKYFFFRKKRNSHAPQHQLASVLT
jgi:Mg2+-importing ATPase